METTQTVSISKANAMEAYSQADEQLKPILATLFGLDQAPEKWEDIKTFEAACLVVPPTENQQILLSYNGQDKDLLAAQAVLKLAIISRAMNKLKNGGEEWKPDWSNPNEYKYYPWLKYVAGSGFSDDGYSSGRTCTDVGSRLCFKTAEMARHAAVHFKDLYNDFFTL